MKIAPSSPLHLGAVLVVTLLQMPVCLPVQGSIVELQTRRTSQSVNMPDVAGRHGIITLINLNPAVNSQFLLTIQLDGRSDTLNFPIENSAPKAQRLALSDANPGHLSITYENQTTQCALMHRDALEKARRTSLAFVPLCNGRLHLRNAVRGSQTALEATTQFLRDHVWHGEQIIGFVRHQFFQDAFMERAGSPTDTVARPLVPVARNAPQPAQMSSTGLQRQIVAPGMGIDLGSAGALLQGQWYAAAGLEGIQASVAQPGVLSGGDSVVHGRGRLLDSVESEALVYLVAFDLASYEIGFALGTEHPRIGWSARVNMDQRDARLPGPDGIADAAPLVRTGMVSPALQSRVVATFTGGFKREHGAFRHGALATVNYASHYGFVEQGVVFSRLNPGLSTLYVLNDGSMGMKTWTLRDDGMIGQIRHARQNGVPLIERDPAGGNPKIGPLVDAWGAGNWSGSADEKLRTLRAGACLIEQAGRQFLVYAYFSSATPRAMARVFHAYGCGYAMHLDMNALEHTYLALYRHIGERISVQHLVGQMAILDKSNGPALLPRFLGFADDRDFFYLMKREVKP